MCTYWPEITGQKKYQLESPELVPPVSSAWLADGKQRAGCKPTMSPRTEVTDQSPHNSYPGGLRALPSRPWLKHCALTFSHTSKLFNGKIHFTGEGTKAPRGQ